jgi:hypothetical protein
VTPHMLLTRHDGVLNEALDGGALRIAAWQCRRVRGGGERCAGGPQEAFLLPSGSCGNLSGAQAPVLSALHGASVQNGECWKEVGDALQSCSTAGAMTGACCCSAEAC